MRGFVSFVSLPPRYYKLISSLRLHLHCGTCTLQLACPRNLTIYNTADACTPLVCLSVSATEVNDAKLRASDPALMYSLPLALADALAISFAFSFVTRRASPHGSRTCARWLRDARGGLRRPFTMRAAMRWSASTTRCLHWSDAY